MQACFGGVGRLFRWWLGCGMVVEHTSHPKSLRHKHLRHARHRTVERACGCTLVRICWRKSMQAIHLRRLGPSARRYHPRDCVPRCPPARPTAYMYLQPPIFPSKTGLSTWYRVSSGFIRFATVVWCLGTTPLTNCSCCWLRRLPVLKEIQFLAGWSADSFQRYLVELAF